MSLFFSCVMVLTPLAVLVGATFWVFRPQRKDKRDKDS